MESNKSQAVTGFKVRGYRVKSTKQGEKICISLEALVDDVGAGDFDVGDVLKAFLNHQTGEIDLGLSVFMKNTKE